MRIRFTVSEATESCATCKEQLHPKTVLAAIGKMRFCTAMHAQLYVAAKRIGFQKNASPVALAIAQAILG